MFLSSELKLQKKKKIKITKENVLVTSLFESTEDITLFTQIESGPC